MHWQQILDSTGVVPSNEAIGKVVVPVVMGCDITRYLDWWVLGV